MLKKLLAILGVMSFVLSAQGEEAPPHPMLRKRNLYQHEKMHHDLLESIDGLFSALHEPLEGEESSYVLFVRSLREESTTKILLLKTLTETILNAPRLDIVKSSLDVQVMALQDYVQESFPDNHDFIPIHRRLFWMPDLREIETYTLSEKQVVFEHYQKVYRLFKQLLYAEHQDNLEQYQALQDRYRLSLTAQGRDDFELFSVRPKYKFYSQGTKFDIIDSMEDEAKVEFEGLALSPHKKNWKRLLKRHALEMLIKRWVRLDEVWMEDRFPREPQFSMLPLSCQHQFPSVVPLSIPLRLKEAQVVPSQVLFEIGFITDLGSDKELQIPLFSTRQFVSQLIEAIPVWKMDHAAYTTEEEREENLSKDLVAIQDVENDYARFVLQWLLTEWIPPVYLWNGNAEVIKSQFREALILSKRIHFLQFIESFLHRKRVVESEETKLKIIEILNQKLEGYSEILTESAVLDRLFNIYLKNKKEVENANEESERLSDKKRRVPELTQDSLKMAQSLKAQNDKIERLQAGSLPPLADTPETFLVAAKVMASQLLDEVRPEAYQWIKRFLVEDPMFPSIIQGLARAPHLESLKTALENHPAIDDLSSVKDGTYAAAVIKYRWWKEVESASADVASDVEKISKAFYLDQALTLSELFQDQHRRLAYEQMIKLEIEGAIPFLKANILYARSKSQDKVAPFYEQLIWASEQNEPQSVLLDLTQQAIWQMKERVNTEMDRFCRVDPESEMGLKLLLSHTILRTQGLMRHPQFHDVNEETMLEISMESVYESAVGEAFLAIILLHFASGPMSRLPYVGSRVFARLPKTMVRLSHTIGNWLAPFALFWGAEDGIRLFFSEGSVIDSIENWQNSRFWMNKSEKPTTVEDLIKGYQAGVDFGDEPVETLFRYRNELSRARGIYAAFAPIQIAFLGGFLGQMWGRYAFKMRPLRVGVPQSLRSLKVPTRFWTFRPGQEILTLSDEALVSAFSRAVDKSITVPKFQSYVGKWIKILRKDLAAHESRWGLKETWEETKAEMGRRINRVWVARHPEASRYFVSHEEMLRLNIEERIRIQSHLALYESAWGMMEGTHDLALSQIGFHQGFSKTGGRLQAYFGSDFLPELQSLSRPDRAVAWATTHLDFGRFINLWFGGWVGYGGPLARAAKRAGSYDFLLETREGLSRIFKMQELLYRTAMQNVIRRRLLEGETVEEIRLTEEELVRELSALLSKGDL